MNDERPEALLKSALEKIVYFEARSGQVENDLRAARTEADRLRVELGQASQREIELRRQIAELEVQLGRAHRDKDELGRLNDALRTERASLLEKLIDASRIQDVPREVDDLGIDLASFISELRGEVLARREQPATQAVNATSTSVMPPTPATAAAPKPVVPEASAPTADSSVQTHAKRLQAEGRLAVTTQQLEQLSSRSLEGRTEETLFGFSVRELSSPDRAARMRAAERLKALGTTAAAPALAAALNAESDPDVIVTLLSSFGAVAGAEGVSIVSRFLDASSPDVRVSALKILIALDPSCAGPHLSAAMKDPDPAVRRRASLLALGLTGQDALELGSRAAEDGDADVRRLAALVLGASGGERARDVLLRVLGDSEPKVRKAAADSLSRVLGVDLGWVVNLEAAQRRRELRRLATMPACHRKAPSAAVTAAQISVTAPPAVAKTTERVVETVQVHATAGTASARAPRVVETIQVHTTVGAASTRTDSTRPIESAAPRAAASAAHTKVEPATAQRPKSSLLAVMAGPEPTALPADEHTQSGRAAPVGDSIEPLCSGLLAEIRCAIRGRTSSELAMLTHASEETISEACALLIARGAVIRRGQKYFVA